MHKTVVSSCVAVLLLAAPNAFAQFKNPAKAAKNLANLDRVVTAVAQKASRGEIVAWVPARFVPSGQVLLQPVQMPIVRTPVTASLLHKIPASANALHVKALSSQFIMGAYGEHGYGKAFYEDQTELARDLVAFYDGKLETRIGPDGHEVNLLALPVDGLLYKPAGYKTPVVLNSQDYFVIYDTQTATGQIAKNTPEVYNLFKPRLEDEIWQAMGKDKVFDDLNNLCDAIMMAHLHKVRLSQLGADVDVAAAVKGAKADVFKQLNVSDELFAYLHQLPAVHETSNGFKAYVVELPVDGLTWVEADGTTHVYNRQEHVMLFFELGSVGIFPRVDVANPQLFKPGQSAPAQKHTVAVVQHPNNGYWQLYESEKKAWKVDRKDKIFENMWNYLYPYHFNSEVELGKILHGFHGEAVNKVRSKAGDVISEVYEIPLPNLTCDINGQTVAADPDEYVFLYNEQTGGNLVKRSDLENANLYEFVER